MIFNKITRLAVLGISLFIFVYSSDDGRPEYMKVPGFKTETIPGLDPSVQSFGRVMQIPFIKLPDSDYSFDLLRQRDDLIKFYRGDYDKGGQGFIGITTVSKPQNSSPEVVLELHGSTDRMVDVPFANKVIESGMAYVRFSRFSVSYTNDLNVDNQHLEKGSWDQQTVIPLNVEVMMVYGVCKRLVELGTKVIHLVGHSRGGILTFECAKEFNAQHFRRIVSGENVGGVVSYTPISAMPVFMERRLTTRERVNFFHGRYDTICPYGLMEYYYRSLGDQRNVSMTTGNFGHLPWGAATTLRGTLRKFFSGLWSNKFSPRGLLRTYVNFEKRMWYLVSGRQWFLTWHLRPTADNFNNACVEIDDDGFRPVVPKRGAITAGVARDISGLPGYLKNMISKGVWSAELSTSAREEQTRIAEIVDIIAKSAATGSSTGGSAAASSSQSSCG